jgi:arylsulfatase A
MHLLEREVTIAEVLRDNGYDTAHLGKWHLGMPLRGPGKPGPEKHGFNYWFGTENTANPSHRNPTNFHRNGEPVGMIEGYACQIVADDAINWLEEKRDPDAPFFLHIWFHEPHSPIAAPDEIVSQYGDLNDRAAIYSGTVDNTDRAIGRLVAKLEKMGELDNTIIIYSSDHGSYRGDRNLGLRGHKGSFFEGGIRSPGIFFWPDGIPAGRIENVPAGAVDLLPTVCGLVGIDKPKGVHLDGSDISPLLTGDRENFTRHQPLFWLWPRPSLDADASPTATIRDGSYTLHGFFGDELFPDVDAIIQLREKIMAALPEDEKVNPGVPFSSRLFSTKFSDPAAERLRHEHLRMYRFHEEWIPKLKADRFQRFELYDLSTDPLQKTDIAPEHPDVVKRLSSQLIGITASVMADGPDWHLQTP